MSYAAVISDLDGVLVDSMAATSRAWARWGERHGVDGAALQAANHGRPAGDVIAEHVAADRLEAETAFLLDAEVGDTAGVDALPGAAEVLALPVVAIATSCLAPLAARGSAPRACPSPDVLVTADQVAAGKPAPGLLSARRRAARPRPGRLPRAGGRAERRRRRPRRGHDGLGGRRPRTRRPT